MLPLSKVAACKVDNFYNFDRLPFWTRVDLPNWKLYHFSTWPSRLKKASLKKAYNYKSVEPKLGTANKV